LLDWRDRSDGRFYNFCCSSRWEHYRLFFAHWEQGLTIECETIIVYQNGKKFEVNQMDDQTTDIYVFEVDGENRVIEGNQPKPVKFSHWLFDFANTTRDKMAHRLETLLVFR
jgi:hypothetical protein